MTEKRHFQHRLHQTGRTLPRPGSRAPLDKCIATEWVLVWVLQSELMLVPMSALLLVPVLLSVLQSGLLSVLQSGLRLVLQSGLLSGPSGVSLLHR